MANHNFYFLKIQFSPPHRSLLSLSLLRRAIFWDSKHQSPYVSSFAIQTGSVSPGKPASLCRTLATAWGPCRGCTRRGCQDRWGRNLHAPARAARGEVYDGVMGFEVESLGGDVLELGDAFVSMECICGCFLDPHVSSVWCH